jgi:hypothetical protein
MMAENIGPEVATALQRVDRRYYSGVAQFALLPKAQLGRPSAAIFPSDGVARTHPFP